MKLVKMTLLMAVLAVSGLAFSQASKMHGTMNERWYLIDTEAPNNPESYSLVNPGSACTGVNEICSILAPEEGGFPVINDPVEGNEEQYSTLFRN